MTCKPAGLFRSLTFSFALWQTNSQKEKKTLGRFNRFCRGLSGPVTLLPQLDHGKGLFFVFQIEVAGERDPTAQ